MIRRIIAIVVGIVVGVLGVTLVEQVSSLIYPLPEDFDWQDAEAVREFIASLPMGAFLFVLAAHAFGAFGGGFTCAAIVRQPWLAGSLIVGGVFLVFGIIVQFMIPHPLWFGVVDVLLYLPAAIAGGKVAGLIFAARTASETGDSPG